MYILQFNPAVPLARSDAPTQLNERMHVLVLVVNAQEFDSYPRAIIDKMKQAMDVAKGQPRGKHRLYSWERGVIRGTVVACWTAGQQVKQLILRQGHDSIQNSSHSPSLSLAQHR